MPEPEQPKEETKEAPPPKEAPKKIPKNRILCRITCLDKNFLTAELPKNSKGLDLMRRVCDQLNIQEREYFGLLFDHKKEKYWLEPRKEIKKQLKGSPPNFILAVKFYEPYPGQLKSDYTRYMLCLQVRDDINCERLPCSFGSQALLGSYIVQAELGDYDPRDHRGNYLEGMIFGPSQTNELVEKIKELHKENRGMTPEQCDTQYLEAARKLTMFGVDAHPATDGNNDEVLVGVSYAGVLVFKDDLRQNRFSWQKVNYLSYKGKDFNIESRPGELDTLTTKMTFKMPSEKAAKRLYKSCVEHHTFFRLSYPDPPPSKTDTLLKKGSKFRYSDKTLYQLRKEGFPVNQDPPKFMRVSSRNWSDRYEPATTTIIVVPDEEHKKRQLSDKDKRGEGHKDKKSKTGERVAPLSEEELMATMTMEEREQYKKRMAERLQEITTTTTTTTVYYPGQERKEGEPDEEGALRAEGVSVVDSAQVAYGVGEKPDSHVRVTALSAAEEREKKKREEEEERLRKQREEEERKREEEKEKERERERERERKRQELERIRDAERAGYAARQPPSETIGYKTSHVTPVKGDAAEMLEFSFATPVSSGDTIKRAKMKTAETDSYKGHVARVKDERPLSDSAHKPAPATAPKPYSHGHSTLPPRGKPIQSIGDEDEDEERRKSAGDSLDRGKRKGVQLITKEELIRCYSPAGSNVEATPEPRERAEPTRFAQKQRESDQVAENIKRHSYGKDLDDTPSAIKTQKVTITPSGEPTVYQKRVPPEVQTQSYTISGVGGPVKEPVNEGVTATERKDVHAAAPSPRGTSDSSRVVVNDIPSVTTKRVLYDQSAQPVGPVTPDQEGGVVVTRTVTIDGNHQTEPVQSEVVRHTTMPTEIVTKTITIEGDGGPLTAEELKEIMAQQGANFDTEVITTTHTTTTRQQRVEKTLTEKTSLVDEDGNVIATGDPDTDRAIAEAIRQAKEADPNVKVTEVVITRGDESIA